MGESRLRLRAALDGQFAIVAAGLVGLALLGGFVTATAYLAPGTATEQRTVSSWESTGEFDHAATVQGNSSVFTEGAVLDNRSVYVTGVMPRLNGTFRHGYEASNGGTVTETVSLSLVLRGVEATNGGEGETVVWESERPLVRNASATLEPGEVHEVPFAVNASAAATRLDRIRGELGGAAGEPEALVRASVARHGTVNGEPVDRSRTYTMALGLAGDTYRPGGTGPTIDEFASTRSVRYQQTYGPLWTVGGPLALAVSLAGLAGLVSARRRGRLELTAAERERLRYEDHRSEFGEWISTVRLPEAALDRPEATADSLAALADVAIDTGNPVIEDPERETYYVVDDVVYTYRPPEDTRIDGEGAVTEERLELGNEGSVPAGPDLSEEPGSAEGVGGE